MLRGETLFFLISSNNLARYFWQGLDFFHLIKENKVFCESQSVRSFNAQSSLTGYSYPTGTSLCMQTCWYFGTNRIKPLVQNYDVYICFHLHIYYNSSFVYFDVFCFGFVFLKTRFCHAFCFL